MSGVASTGPASFTAWALSTKAATITSRMAAVSAFTAKIQDPSGWHH